MFKNLSYLCASRHIFSHMTNLEVKFHFIINSFSVCATIAQTEAIGKCHLSAFYIYMQGLFCWMNQFFQGMLRLGLQFANCYLALVCSTSQLSLTFPFQDSIEQWFRSPKKPGNILRCHETTSEEGVQKFYTNNMSLPRFGKQFSLFEANFSHSTTNQKHDLDTRSQVISIKFLFVPRTTSLFNGETSGGITKIKFVALGLLYVSGKLSTYLLMFTYLPQVNINTYFSFGAKYWLRGGVGGQFPRSVL